MARSHALVGSEKHVIVSKSSEMTVYLRGGPVWFPSPTHLCECDGAVQNVEVSHKIWVGVIN